MTLVELQAESTGLNRMAAPDDHEAQEANPQPQALETETPERTLAKTWRQDVRQLAEVLVVACAMFIVAFVLYQPVRVEGTSMLPVLEDQDQLFINKVALSQVGSLVGEHIRQGDVLVFRYPLDTSKKYIKRVVALPGDTVRINHGTVIVNGVAVEEKYVPAKYTDERSMPEIKLGPTEYFMMGDHRSVSSDSRDFGPVKRNLIEGRAAFVFWPMDQAGAVH